MKPTPGQKRAIESIDRSLVVQAGAGTGKTWVLVERFVFLLETNPDWSLDDIIAITFTEKAAREMRSRIRKAVENRARSDPHSSVWQARRRNLNRLQVSTIHSLCARILRENALEAMVDPAFQVIDEQEAGLIQEEALRLTLSRLGENDHPALELLASLNVYDFHNILADMLDQQGTLSRLFQELPSPEEMLRRWEDGVRAMGQEVWQLARAENPDLEKALVRLARLTIEDETDKLAESAAAGRRGARLARQERCREAAQEWLSIDLRGGRQASWGGKESLRELKDDLKCVRSTAREMEKIGALLEIGENEKAAAEHLQLWSQIWTVLEDTYRGLKEEASALDFDDLEENAARLLTRDPLPDRLMAFIQDVRHLLVDEFQDTNQRQQDIVYALAPPESGRLFIVGDAKQSIYRFRQADVRVFRATSRQIRDLEQGGAVDLETTFRAHQALTAALNDLFQEVLKPAVGEHAEYEAPPGPLISLREPPESEKISVEMLLLPAETEEEERLDANEARIWEARWLAGRLKDMRRQKKPIWDDNIHQIRPFEYGDAAVLFRATTHLPVYEREFKESGVPYLTVSGRGYYDRPEVLDLISLLKAIQNPRDEVSFVTALRSPLFNLSDETLFNLRWREPDGTLSAQKSAYRESVDDPPPSRQAREISLAADVFRDLWRTAGVENVWTVLRKALDWTGYEAALAMNDGGTGRQLENVRKFLSMARDYDRADLAGFIQRIGDLQAREAREGEAPGSEPTSGVVQLMSIHAAKGLEFPVVAAADLGRGMKGGGGSSYFMHDPTFGIVCKQRDRNGEWGKNAGYQWGEWLNARMDEAESKRLLYVACTRAADYLILSGKTGNKWSWLADILRAWSINELGPEKEHLSFDEYGILVHRPTTVLPRMEADYHQVSAAVQLHTIPDLVQPISVSTHQQSLAVTDWIREHLPTGGQDSKPPLLAFLDRYDTQSAGRMLGSIIHQALARWDYLTMSDKKLAASLEKIAIQKGGMSGKLSMVLEAAIACIRSFREHPVFGEIQSSEARFPEVNFSWMSEIGILHGVIDLLYRDRNSQWKLVEWKTEVWPEGHAEERRLAYGMQLAFYLKAVQGIWKHEPEVYLGIFKPEFSMQTVQSEELNLIWKEILKEF